MPCRYHKSAVVAGRCKDCLSEFCQDCAIEIIRHGTVCLDWGTRFARKKLRQAYWAAGIGLAFGIVISAMAISERQWLMALWPPIVYPCFFPAVFFGFHYGGKIWARLAVFAERFEGMAGMIAAICVLAVRLTIAIYAGVFGGGIVQFLRYRKMVAFQESLASASSVAVAAG